MKKIGVLTSGGDSPGMNAALRSVVHEACNNSIDVIGFKRGFAGLIDNDYIDLNIQSVGGIIQRGGTILLTARSEHFRTTEGQKAALEVLEKHEIEHMVVIGGDGSFHGALALSDLGINVIGIPATIDNDIYGTEMSIGVDTALNTIMEVVDKIKDTASSHQRTFIVEVMGRNSGYLAMVSSVVTGAEACIVPEIPPDYNDIVNILKEGYLRGKTNSLVIVAEGASTAFQASRKLGNLGGIECRITTLGHLQRGGSPTCFDRFIATRLGMTSVEMLLNGETGKMVGLIGRKVELTDFNTVFAKKYEYQEKLFELAKVLGNI
ncbi:MAG: 6-phosphofructokinase [candidate division Zixibacteria bacterium]|nr:6-phosphofructokinase [candidate division Zixibacteria bacterium]